MELLGLYDQAAEVNVTRTAVTRSLCAVSLASGATRFFSFEDFVLAYGERAPRRIQSGHAVSLRDEAPIHGNPHALVL